MNFYNVSNEEIENYASKIQSLGYTKNTKVRFKKLLKSAFPKAINTSAEANRRSSRMFSAAGISGRRATRLWAPPSRLARIRRSSFDLSCKNRPVPRSRRKSIKILTTTRTSTYTVRIFITHHIIAHTMDKQCQILFRRENFMVAGIIIGTFIGGFLGVAFMCLLYYSRG